MKLKLTGPELEKFIKKAFPGLTNYSLSESEKNFYIGFTWKRDDFLLVVYKNKEFDVNTYTSPRNFTAEKIIRLVINNQLEIESKNQEKILINNLADFKKLIKTLNYPVEYLYTASNKSDCFANTKINSYYYTIYYNKALNKVKVCSSGMNSYPKEKEFKSLLLETEKLISVLIEQNLNGKISR